MNRTARHASRRTTRHGRSFAVAFAALTVITSLGLVGVGQQAADAQAASQHTVSITNPRADQRLADARSFCGEAVPARRALCVKVMARPAFSWTPKGGGRVSDPAGPANIADILADYTLNSPGFLVGLKGYDADWRAAHPAHQG